MCRTADEARWTSSIRTRSRSSTISTCRGVDHMDFSADGRFLIASCEFSGDLVKVDVATHKVLDVLKLSPHAMPQDVRLSPDGTTFYVADMMGNGVFAVDGNAFKVMRF